MKVKIRKSNIKQRTTGFRARMSTKNGRKILNGRRRIGKKKMTKWN